MLKVDDREPAKIFKYLEDAQLPHERLILPIGDFVDEDAKVVIERKSVEDFVQSFRTHHLQHQLARMQEMEGYHRFLLISGDFEALHFKGIQLTVEQRLGMLASIASRFNVKIVQVTNDKQLCAIVPKLIEKSAESETSEMVIHPHVRVVSDSLLNILMCVPKIGLKKAEAIKERYPSLRILIDELEKGDIDVKGVGDELKKNLRSAFGLNE